VIVSGVRLPFATTASGLYKDELAVDLQRLAFQGLFTETALPKDQVDYVISGNVIQEVRTSNLAREAAINAGLPVHVGAHTIAQVCHFLCTPIALVVCLILHIYIPFLGFQSNSMSETVSPSLCFSLYSIFGLVAVVAAAVVIRLAFRQMLPFVLLPKRLPRDTPTWSLPGAPKPFPMCPFDSPVPFVKN
jgi:hypothetical protein